MDDGLPRTGCALSGVYPKEVYRDSCIRNINETVSATCNDTFARNRMINRAGLCCKKETGLKNSLLGADLLTIQRNLQF